MFLPSALMDAMDRIKALASTGLAREITETAAQKFCNDFEEVENLILCLDGLVGGDESGAASGEQLPLRAYFPRTTGDVHVLFD